MRIKTGFIIFIAIFLASCGGHKTAHIWTDRPEFAYYGEYFNSIQNQYKVMVMYYKFPAAEFARHGIKKEGNHPDIIAGSWIRNAVTSTHFKSMNSVFGANKLSRTVFYPRLLAVGRIDRNQYLLPVSFNVPALVFPKNREQTISNPFTIGFDEIKNLSKNYNTENRGVYTRMGFSPFWDSNFLFITASLHGSSFREASPLAWNTSVLDSSMDFINEWTHEINTNNQMEEDFTFKYFIEPPARLIQSGRILFSYMESSELFTLSEDSKSDLDFRWIADNDKIPLIDGSVYLGILKKGKAHKAAEAFVQWFFTIETQRHLLETSKANRVNENVFGICGGFSALAPVTEQIFPRFYPDLLGRMPPSEYLMPTNNLPANWITIKERVVLPYLYDSARKKSTEEIYPLERRISDWIRING